MVVRVMVAPPSVLAATVNVTTDLTSVRFMYCQLTCVRRKKEGWGRDGEGMGEGGIKRKETRIFAGGTMA